MVLLLEQIVQLFLCIVLGWLLVQLRLLKPEDSRVLSKVCLYLVTPCVIINAFQIQRTPELLQGLTLSLGAAIGIHVLFFIATALLCRPLHLTPVEQASLIYTNSGNLIIPLVTAVLGSEWVIYCSMFQLVQQFPMWSHCRIILSGDRNISLKKILLNVNIVSVLVGVLLFLLNLSLPSVIAGTMKSIAATIGPLSMFVAGMLMGDQDLLAVLRIRSIWKVAFLRLIVLPLVVLGILKYSGLASLVPDGESILLISLLAASAPAASNVTQIAQVYGHEGDYASAINVITTLFCIGTMPLMVLLYQL
ncbi:AEC family transporter [uncultured Oscillibacter sp.]|uniref:AEC family transporter n=1 Tax=uncultured Oscillibacter sp. TaxID=876091 RepID=UPI0028056F94|nr:AEC family transporter [uncultured Oscillibacter sp.]